MLSQRDVTSLYATTLFFHNVYDLDGDYLCSNYKDMDTSWFNFYVSKLLEIEDHILKYQKSNKGIYRDYNNLIGELDSNRFCEYTEDYTRIY